MSPRTPPPTPVGGNIIKKLVENYSLPIKEPHVDLAATQSYDSLSCQYHELWDVCNKKNADQLPSHCPSDCPIELIPGEDIPFGCLSNLS